MTNFPKNRGYVGILLVIIVLILAIITTAAVSVGVSSLKDTTLMSRSQEVYALAESGVDNAILRLLRDPSYSGEPNLPIGEGNVTIEVSGGSAPYTITSTAQLGGVIRGVQATVENVAGTLTITNWQLR